MESAHHAISPMPILGPLQTAKAESQDNSRSRGEPPELIQLHKQSPNAREPKKRHREPC
jgi:hypothetical protein